jgi:hypothetical protein
VASWLHSNVDAERKIMKNIFKKILITGITSIFLFNSSNFLVLAEQQENTATIQFSEKDSETATVTNIPDATFVVYKVADITYNGNAASATYTLVDEYKETATNFDGMTAEKSNEAAEKIFALANKIDPVATGKTNEDGQVTFANLPDGMYLVAETKAEGEASKYELAKPFLVSLPLYTSGEWKHNVTISPKSEVKKVPNEKPVVPPSEKPKADTGISTNSSILMLLAVLLTASAGVYMISQKEEEAC